MENFVSFDGSLINVNAIAYVERLDLGAANMAIHAVMFNLPETQKGPASLQRRLEGASAERFLSALEAAGINVKDLRESSKSLPEELPEVIRSPARLDDSPPPFLDMENL